MTARLDLPNRIRGVIVTKVDGEAGELRTGDVIEEVNQQPVTSVAEYKKVVASLDPNGTQVLSVCRHRTRSFVVLRPRIDSLALSKLAREGFVALRNGLR